MCGLQFCNITVKGNNIELNTLDEITELDGKNEGFERAHLTQHDLTTILPKAPHIISHGKNQGIKITCTSLIESQQVWNALRKIFHNQDFVEGVRFEYARCPKLFKNTIL